MFGSNCLKRNQQALKKWLSHALTCKIPQNNWTFFLKVLIRVALYQCVGIHWQNELTQELALIDSMYIGDGWYVDGKVTQRDYYVAFAFHYYGLIYATFMKEEDPEWSERFIERATLFAQDFIYYFDEDGEAFALWAESDLSFCSKEPSFLLKIAKKHISSF